jgi:hypothetical protein
MGRCEMLHELVIRHHCDDNTACNTSLTLSRRYTMLWHEGRVLACVQLFLTNGNESDVLKNQINVKILFMPQYKSFPSTVWNF